MSEPIPFESNTDDQAEIHEKGDHVEYVHTAKIAGDVEPSGRIETLGLTMHLAKNIDERHEDGIRDEQEGEW